MEKGIFNYVVLALLVWAVSGSTVAGYYFTQYNLYQSEYSNLVAELNTLSDAVVDLSTVFSASITNLSQSVSGEMSSISNTIEDLSLILESISLKVNILLSFGNSSTWLNGTKLPLGSTAFTAVLAIADIKYTDHGGELGVLVTSVNGVANNQTHGWFFWYWEVDTSKWVLGEYSSTKYIIHRDDTIAWAYSDFTVWPPPPPT